MVNETLLLRQISEEVFTTYLGTVAYIRTDLANDLRRVREWHTALAKGRGLSDCGCDYCAVLGSSRNETKERDDDNGITKKS
jgi:hypothetical protein